MSTEIPDVCLFLEGTYPYVAGGVSGWVHDLLTSHSSLRFTLVHIGVKPGVAQTPRYQLPSNVVGLQHLYLQAPDQPIPRGTPRAALEAKIARLRRRATPQAVASTLHALAKLHLEQAVDDEQLNILGSAVLSADDLCHGSAAFRVIDELAQRLAPGASFLDFFWHFRAMHVPLLRLLSAELPDARIYHSVTTGYAGAVGAIGGFKRRRPLIITEHGLYAHEREMELTRAAWIEQSESHAAPGDDGSLRRLWSRFFRALSRIAYHCSWQIVTLSDGNRQKQIADGADPERTLVIQNGIDVAKLEKFRDERSVRIHPLRVGFVGRVVTIKDVLTFIRACDRALTEVPIEVQIIGPEEEEPEYAARCRALVASLNRGDQIRFVGVRPVDEIYRDLDVIVLTSLSEGQPLVMLEAFAAGVPVVATDVGGCRELIEGAPGVDEQLGVAGIVTRLASPGETAAALVRLARDPALRANLGRVGQKRASMFYQRRDMLNRYRALWSAAVSL